MKVYTLTFQFTRNYGAELQAYSLYSFLSEQGYETQVIDYYPPYTLQKSKKSSFPKSIFLYLIRKRTEKSFRKFGDHFISLTRKCHSVSDISNLSPADAIIVGSDQVWNPVLLGEINDGYFLNFPTDARRISYAASIGQNKLDEQTMQSILPLIGKFDSVSVREKNFVNVLQERGIRATHVLDPVFLHDADFYRKIESKKNYGKYVLTYYSDQEHLTERLALQIAEQLGCQVLKIGSYKNVNGIKGTGFTTIQDFINLVNHAEYIVTRSFHGIAFSIIFQKQFYAISAGNRSSRITSLLSTLKLEDRFVDMGCDISKIPLDGIDYSSVYSLLKLETENSKQFILDSLK